jgi:hypothetical protein
MNENGRLVSACIHLNHLSGNFLNYYYTQNKTDDDIKTMKILIICMETAFKEFIEESEKIQELKK